jgi:hypothetical protein
MSIAIFLSGWLMESAHHVAAEMTVSELGLCTNAAAHDESFLYDEGFLF